jgi:hypothetical protein
MLSQFKSLIYKYLTPILSLLVFAISLVVYVFTLEPTVSLWDCGEFITAANQLQVPHPPGSPLFLMLARIASLLAVSPTQIAYCINLLSAVSSAATVTLLFLFLQSFLFSLSRNFTPCIVRLGAVAVSLSFAFTDSFWFSAVESEVYALSSFFTMLSLWLVWQIYLTEPSAKRNKLILSLSLVLGLSVNVHMLNLLVILPIAVLLFPKGENKNWLWLFKSLGVGVAVLLFAMLGVVKYSVRAAAWVEINLVNSFHLPVHSGWILFYGLLLAVLLVLAYVFQKKNNLFVNTSLLGVFFFTLGFSLYFTVIIRSAQNPIMNENAPTTIVGLRAYLERDQYSQAPLLYGPSFASPIVGSSKAEKQYRVEKNMYKVVNEGITPEYASQTLVWFPRMYSADMLHQAAYKSWSNFEGKNLQLKLKGKNKTLEVPTVADNLRFFVNYQLGFMYFRYAMWNFAGRQNDAQGNGGIMRGNWITGFNFLDAPRLGNQSTMPASLKNETAQTRYFLIPILLILLGLCTLRFVRLPQASFLILWFFVTGVAIAIYLNMTPMQARERDYAFVGSFMALSVFMALGLVQLLTWIVQIPYGKYVACVSVGLPLLFLVQNYPSHNRSQRVAARTSALHLLESCPSNAILFTIGDNETFPLWYLQQVEGVRADVSVVNSLLLYSPWYLQQITCSGKSDLTIKTHFRVSDFDNGRLRNFYLKKNEKTISLREGVDNVVVALNKPTQLLVSEASFSLFNPFTKKLTDTLLYLPEQKLSVNELLMLDIVAHNADKRPLCFSTPGIATSLNVRNLLQPVGLVYCLSADTVAAQQYDVRLWQRALNMHSYSRGQLDFFHQQNIQVLGYRERMANTALQLVRQNKKEQAASLVRSALHYTPENLFPQCCNLKLIEALRLSGNDAEAAIHLDRWKKRAEAELLWFNSLSPNLKQLSFVEIDRREKLLRKIELLK